jgi:hypothetical protein
MSRLFRLPLLCLSRFLQRLSQVHFNAFGIFLREIVINKRFGVLPQMFLLCLVIRIYGMPLRHAVVLPLPLLLCCHVCTTFGSAFWLNL